VKLDLDMTMPGMVMHSPGAADKTGAGEYHTKLTPNMAGDWNAKLSIEAC
jgi:hypothetical protein